MSGEFDIIVVGGGIAGLTAGLTAARLGHNTLVLTGDTLGGHLLNIEKIDGYPGFPDGVPGFDLCPIAQEQAMTAGAEFAMGSLTSLTRGDSDWSLTGAGQDYTARTVVLATGTRLKTLDIPGESQLRGKGVSQCASCDAPLLRDKTAIVAGGGDSALQEALTLAEHCTSVTIVHHGDKYSAQQDYVSQIEALGNVHAVPDSELTEILGDDGVTGVRVTNKSTGDASEIECASVFGFIGLEPNTKLLTELSVLNDDGWIVTDDAMSTSQPGLFAAGTVRAGSTARAASAAGEGAAAALAASRFLTDN